MPAITVPLYPNRISRPSPMRYGTADSPTRFEAGPIGDPIPAGSNDGEPVTGTQVQFELSSGKLAHNASFRYNRYTRRWLDYDKLRAMRRDPTIALARDAAVAPIIASSWTIEVTDKSAPDWLKPYVERYILPFRTKLLRTALYGEIDYGWRAYEKTLNVVRDKQLGLKVIPQRIKPLLVDTTWARYSEDGDFDGLLHRNPMTNQWYNIDYEHSMFANFDDDGLGNYNDPYLLRAEQAYDDWQTANDVARRYDEKIAGAVWLIEYPEGNNFYKGERTENSIIAKDIAYQIKSSGYLTIPSKLLAAAEVEMENMGQSGWRISLMESSVKGADFIPRLDYLDKLKIRSIGVLERAITEGNYGTKAEAESHINLMLLNQQLKHADLTDWVNEWLVNHMTAVNANVIDAIKFVPQPLTDERRDLFIQLYSQYLTNPDTSQEVSNRTDLAELMRIIGIPQVSEQLLQERTQGLGNLISLVSQAVQQQPATAPTMETQTVSASRGTQGGDRFRGQLEFSA